MNSNNYLGCVVFLLVLIVLTAPIWYRPKARKFRLLKIAETHILSPLEAYSYLRGQLPAALPKMVVDYTIRDTDPAGHNWCVRYLASHKDMAERLNVIVGEPQIWSVER